MALDKLIPRIEWNEISIVGDTHTTTTVDGIADTSDIKVGMIVTGSGIQAGTTVISKAANSMVLSLAATSTLSDITLTLFERFDFEFPPELDSEEKRTPKNTVKESLAGLIQVQTNYVEVTRDLKFGMLLHTDKDTLMMDFYDDYAVYGNSFRYFYDKNDSGYVTYELEKYPLTTPRRAKKHPYFLYDMAFTFRRVL